MSPLTKCGPCGPWNMFGCNIKCTPDIALAKLLAIWMAGLHDAHYFFCHTSTRSNHKATSMHVCLTVSYLGSKFDCAFDEVSPGHLLSLLFSQGQDHVDVWHCFRVLSQRNVNLNKQTNKQTKCLHSGTNDMIGSMWLSAVLLPHMVTLMANCLYI